MPPKEKAGIMECWNNGILAKPQTKKNENSKLSFLPFF